MTTTYEKIATTTLGAGAASVTFSSISASYTDLVLVAVSTAVSSANNMTMQFNSDTGSNYSRTFINGNGSSATSSRSTSQTKLFVGDFGNPTIPSVVIINLMNYSNTTTYKTVVGRYGEADIQTGASVGLWQSTSAINAMTIFAETNNFASGSTFTLYGIKAE